MELAECESCQQTAICTKGVCIECRDRARSRHPDMVGAARTPPKAHKPLSKHAKRQDESSGDELVISKCNDNREHLTPAGGGDMAAQMAEVRAQRAREFAQRGVGKGGVRKGVLGAEATCPRKGSDKLQTKPACGGVGGRPRTAEDVLKELEEDLTCSVCLELLTRPVTLNDCGHSFCFLCLRTMVANTIAQNRQDEGDGARYHCACPTCRVRIKHPPTAPNHIMAKCVKTLVNARPPTERREIFQRMLETEQRADMVMEAAAAGDGGAWGYFAAQRPMYDEDDGVWRCTLCAWEIDDEGLCENPKCGKRWDVEEKDRRMGAQEVRGRGGDVSDEELADGEEGVNDEDDSALDSYDSSFINDSEPEMIDSGSEDEDDHEEEDRAQLLRKDKATEKKTKKVAKEPSSSEDGRSGTVSRKRRRTLIVSSDEEESGRRSADAEDARKKRKAAVSRDCGKEIEDEEKEEEEQARESKLERRRRRKAEKRARQAIATDGTAAGAGGAAPSSPPRRTKTKSQRARDRMLERQQHTGRMDISSDSNGDADREQAAVTGTEQERDSGDEGSTGRKLLRERRQKMLARQQRGRGQAGNGPGPWRGLQALMQSPEGSEEESGEEEEGEPCSICKSSSNPERTLLCDSCDRAFHIDCLRPPLSAVPPGDWYCRRCVKRGLADEEHPAGLPD